MVITVREDDPRSPAATALLALHLATTSDDSPAEYRHALDGERLVHPDITFWTVWRGGALAGIGALRRLDDDHAEVKSMRTHPDHLRKGVAQALLDRIVATARARGYRRISLETGTSPMFRAASALYERAGFVDGPVFGGYPASPHNRFMTMQL